MTSQTQNRLLVCGAVLFFLLAFTSAHQLRKVANHRTTSLTEFYVSDSYLQDLGAVMLGARRVAADLAYIQLMQYYGVGIHTLADEDATHHHHDDDAEEVKAKDNNFQKLNLFGIRILRLDPLFHTAILEVAGSLSFNEKRLQEALDLLAEAIKRDPNYYRYHLYVAAILYKNQGLDDKLIEVLDEAVKYRDCAAVMQTILANLHKKYGHYEKAAALYADIMENAPKESDRNDAQSRLEELLKQHPSLSVPLPRRK